MLCPKDKWADNQEFLDLVSIRTAQKNIPFNGGMDLTSSCNLQCMHCYIRGASRDTSMLSRDVARRIIDESAAAGCLFFLITGGEPLLHPNFAEIYMHARERGMLVTVFTNGTLINEDVASLFREATPLGVEISVYGAEAEMHDSITGVSGSFESSMRGVHLLKNAGINVSLKTIVMSGNESQFEDMRDLASELDVSFRMDAAVFPHLSGSKEPVDLRVDARRAVECEFALKGRSADWQKYLKKIGKIETDGSLYTCGAGRTSFHVSSGEMLQPCLMTPHLQVSLQNQSFEEAWHEVSGLIDSNNAAPDNPCRSCENNLLCDGCPGFFRLESGSENCKSEYLCSIAEGRASALQGLTDAGKE